MRPRRRTEARARRRQAVDRPAGRASTTAPHHAHADRRLMGAAEGDRVVDDRRGGQEREQAPAETERQETDTGWRAEQQLKAIITRSTR